MYIALENFMIFVIFLEYTNHYLVQRTKTMSNYYWIEFTKKNLEFDSIAATVYYSVVSIWRVACITNTYILILNIGQYQSDTAIW